jgi:hypothetical protein
MWCEQRARRVIMITYLFTELPVATTTVMEDSTNDANSSIHNPDSASWQTAKENQL